MPRHLLTDRTVRSAKPESAAYRMADGDNLYLRVSPTGAKSWQFRYGPGNLQTHSLGKYPAVTLERAREAAQEARELVAVGKHLTREKEAKKAWAAAEAKNTFRAASTDWLEAEAKRMQWTADYRREVQASIDNHLAALYPIPVTAITARVVAPIKRKVEKRAPLMLEKVERRLNAVMDYCVELGTIERNPLPPRRRGRPAERKHFAAVTDLSGIGEILRAARTSDPCKGIARAHLLLVGTALRVSEVVGAKWSEFALDGVDRPAGNGHATKLDPYAGNWTIPRERMKQHKDKDRGPHVVPLPFALLAQLREWRQADGTGAIWVCPAPRDAKKPITAEAVEKHYRNVLKLGGKHSPHSWRSAFSTVAREAGKEGDAIEAQLDHVVGNKVASAYDRAKRLELRRDLIQWYEETLIAARDGTAVTRIKNRRGAA